MAIFSGMNERRSHEVDPRPSLDRIPGLIVALTSGGAVEHVNRQLQSYLGGAAEGLTSWTEGGVIHPEDLPHVVEAISDPLAGSDSHELEYRVRRRDGLYRWFRGRGSCVREGDRDTPVWYLLLTDIEDRKRTEAALRSSEALLSACQSLGSMGTFSWSVATDELVCSAQLSAILEVEPRSLASMADFEGHLHPEDQALFRGAVVRALETRDDFHCELKLRMSNDATKYVQLLAHAARDAASGLEYLGVVQDVTERRLAEQLLEQAQAELARLNRVMSLGVLSASIAHEINQPLSGIITNANTCLRMLAAEPPNLDGARDTARRTIRAGNRAAEVTARLRLLFSHGKVTLEALDLNEAVREVLALSLSDLRKNDVLVQQELAADLPLVIGDRVQLQQVVLNLLLNAREAMSGIDERPRELLIRTERDDGGSVRLTMRDSGSGIEPSNLNKVFESFYTTKSSGMGIGLSVSRSIVESYGGRLWAAPNDGPGATFAFSLRCLA
jgi:PAS domain S-box-containing protein